MRVLSFSIPSKIHFSDFIIFSLVNYDVMAEGTHTFARWPLTCDLSRGLRLWNIYTQQNHDRRFGYLSNNSEEGVWSYQHEFDLVSPPKYLLCEDACNHGLGGWNHLGEFYDFLTPDKNLLGHAHINEVEFLACVIHPWMDIISSPISLREMWHRTKTNLVICEERFSLVF